MSLRLVVLAAAWLAAVTAIGHAAESDLEFEGFPFRIPYDGPVEGTAPADLAAPDGMAGADGFVRVEGDHFVIGEGGQPVRFWGTNLCFAGCFPPHDVAERMARRLSTLGFNCVRFHHMDAHGWPNGIWDTENRWGDFEHESLHPEALDRLDYLVAELKKYGIYVNLNLHVSRTYGPADGFPAASEGESVPKYGKGVDNFFPACIAEQKRYARMLLRHVNRYTGKPYAEEPAVAMVEISNEDGLLGAWQRGWLDDLPAAYTDALEAQWNRWLSAEYKTTDALRRAWAEGRKPGNGEDLLADPSVQGRLQTIEDTRATLEEGTGPDAGPIGIITVQKGSPELWHVQHLWAPIAVDKGQAYVLRIRLRANRTDEVRLNCMMSHEPWQHLGLNRILEVGPRWRDYELFFVASRDETPEPDGSGGARVSLSNLAKDGLQVAFTRPTLRRAAVNGLRNSEGLETGVQWPQRDAFARRTPAVRRDVVRFLRDTEGDYWGGMCDFLHGELGVRIPVTGTAVGFTTPHVAAETVDFVDSHAYWQHPRFPGRPWDRENWYVVNDPMVNSPERSTAAALAGRRVFGRPFTVRSTTIPSRTITKPRDSRSSRRSGPSRRGTACSSSVTATTTSGRPTGCSTSSTSRPTR
ncbi:MAG: cellulase family glycosylhydrolase [Candidatus Brocadiia bacterium]